MAMSDSLRRLRTLALGITAIFCLLAAMPTPAVAQTDASDDQEDVALQKCNVLIDAAIVEIEQTGVPPAELPGSAMDIDWASNSEDPHAYPEIRRTESTTAEYVKSLEKLGCTKTLGTPRLSVLNKQRVEIHLGDLDDLEHTQSKIRIRPFLKAEDSLRLEVHVEHAVQTAPNTTHCVSFTTNLMFHDGNTIAIPFILADRKGKPIASTSRDAGVRSMRVLVLNARRDPREKPTVETQVSVTEDERSVALQKSSVLIDAAIVEIEQTGTTVDELPGSAMNICCASKPEDAQSHPEKLITASSITEYIKSLEKVGWTKQILAAPQVSILNKQRAEIQFGNLDEAQHTQSIARIRPFLLTDDCIRLEVHLDHTIQIAPDTTHCVNFTTNVMSHDGDTIGIAIDSVDREGKPIASIKKDGGDRRIRFLVLNARRYSPEKPAVEAQGSVSEHKEAVSLPKENRYLR